MKLVLFVTVALAAAGLPVSADEPPLVRQAAEESTAATEAEDAEMEAAIERLSQEQDEPAERIKLWNPPRISRSEIIPSEIIPSAELNRGVTTVEDPGLEPRRPLLNDAPIPPVPTLDPASPVQKRSSDPAEHVRQVDRLLEWLLRGY